MDLRVFKYHPDPIATGWVVPSDAVCECCEQPRGLIYTGPVYADLFRCTQCGALGGYQDCD